MKYNTPKTYKLNISKEIPDIASRLIISKDKHMDYYAVKALTNIKKDEIILLEYPECTLYGEVEIDRGLQVVKKYIEYMNTEYIKELYPRDFVTFKPNTIIKNIHKIIKHLDTEQKHNVQVTSIIVFFKQYSKQLIEFYYAKYIYNAFEGFHYGPLTLPMLAKFNHSCKNNNIIFKFDSEKGCMIVKTTCDIKKGDELFNSYLYNKNIENHKAYILEHYNFDCGCNSLNSG
jgi:hypothetical protein